MEKLQQWWGRCDITFTKAKEARMILSTLPPWLKGIINTRVAKVSQQTRMAPTFKELLYFWNNASKSMTPQGPMNGGKPSPPGWLEGKCPSLPWRSAIFWCMGVAPGEHNTKAA